MKPIRVFFAIDLPEKMKAILHNLIIELKKQNPHSSIRWCQSHDLHITLHYIASLKIEDINLLIKNVETSLKSFSSFDLEFGDVELFPSIHKPHVLSFNVKSNIVLTDMVRTIGKGILTTEYKIETRPFQGHITLARLYKIKKEDMLITTHSPEIEKIKVKEIVLYESKPASLGPQYIPLKTIQLQNLS